MSKSIAKFFTKLCCAVVVLALMAGITAVQALALSNGIYIATASPHYKHPVTGVIEDSGGEGSAVLGQSMTESALYNKALVEVDNKGTTYITVRLKLMDNIENPEFEVDGKSVSASLMQEDYTENTADYRMKVPSEKSIIKCSMYVVPMGRQVKFFITVSDLTSGSGDFITSVTVSTTKKPDMTKAPAAASPETPAPATEAPKTDAPVTSSLETTAVTTVSDTTSKAPQSEPESVLESSITESTSTSVSSDVSSPDTTSKVLGIQEFDENGSSITETSVSQSAGTSGSNAGIIVLVIVIIAAAAGIAFAVRYFVFFKKKK